MTTDGTVLQTGDPAAVGMSAAQLERAFGLLTAAVEARPDQRGLADGSAARQRGLRTRNWPAKTRQRPASRCGLDLSPRVNHQAGHRFVR